MTTRGAERPGLLPCRRPAGRPATADNARNRQAGSRLGGFGAMACGVAIGLTMAGGTMLMGQSQRHKLDAEEVWTRKVVIVDERGNVRGVLGMADAGECGFSFRDRAGDDRAWLAVDGAEGSSRLNLRDGGGNAAIVEVLPAGKGAGIKAEGVGDASMVAGPEGAGFLVTEIGKAPRTVWSTPAAR